MEHFTKRDTKAIRKWLASNGFKVGCRLGKEMCYDPEGNYMVMPSNYDEDFDFDFMKFLRDNGLTDNFDAITLSILHELGHAQTYQYFTDEEWLEDNIVKSVLTYTVSDQRRLNFMYWNRATEFSANNWLIMYVKSFPQKVEELEKIVSDIYWK